MNDGALQQGRRRVVDGRDRARARGRGHCRQRSRRPCTRRRSARARAWRTPTCCRAARRSTRASARADPDKRVFILTRSAFAGSQRYAAATWSGDVSSDWDSLRKQIPAGLNMSLSGHPVVDDRHRRLRGAAASGRAATRGPRTSRSGASSRRAGSSTRRSAPLLRVHGQFPYREMWFFGGDEGHRAYDDAAGVRPAALPPAAVHLLARRAPSRTATPRSCGRW